MVMQANIDPVALREILRQEEIERNQSDNDWSECWALIEEIENESR